MSKAPNFALLIGKPKKREGRSEKDDEMDRPVEEPSHDEDLEMDKESMEDSAIKDLISSMKSGDTVGAKDALKDFLEACYPSLSSGEEKEDDI